MFASMEVVAKIFTSGYTIDYFESIVLPASTDVCKVFPA